MVLSEAELAVIADLAQRHDLWLIADEVYAGLAPGGTVPSLAARLPGRVVTLGSLSKSHAMTGWRAGWLVASQEFTTHAIALAMCMLFGLPGFIQEAAITALAMAPEAEARIRAFCADRQAHFEAGMGRIPQLRLLRPQAGMFMLLDVTATGLTGAQFMRGLFTARNAAVSVMDGAAFGAATAGCVRVCFASEEATLDAACARIRRFCNEERRRALRHGPPPAAEPARTGAGAPAPGVTPSWGESCRPESGGRSPPAGAGRPSRPAPEGSCPSWPQGW